MKTRSVEFMPIQRVFLELDRPALHAAVSYFIGRYQRDDCVDMTPALVVTTSARANRRLLELLIQETQRQNLRLLPPDIETIGALPERLYHPRLPLAGDLVQQLAWAEALRMMDRDALRPLVPEPPPEDDLPRWRDLGQLIRRQHIDLASAALNFHDVAQRHEAEGLGEATRWRTLHQVQLNYHKLLDDEEIWDAQSARLYAIHEKECATTRDILLLAVADMNQAMKQMLDQVAQQTTTLVYAQEYWAGRFDEYGCLEASEWETPILPIQTEQVRLTENSLEQAEETVRCLAGYQGEYAVEEITIGVPDLAIVGQLERQLEQSGVTARFGPGRSIMELAPYRLLAAVADYVEGERYPNFASLIRHADVSAWLDFKLASEPIATESKTTKSTDWLTACDEYFAAHLPLRFAEPWLGQEPAHTLVKAVHTHIQQWTETLRAIGKKATRRLDQWTSPLTKLLLAIYEQREFDRTDPIERLTLLACERLHATLLEHQNIPESLAPKMTAAEAIRLTLSELSGDRIAAPVDEPAVEMVGWLDLPLDDAPALVVTSFNEPFVPRAVSGDLFLPNSLRVELGLDDNQKRYARDAYAVSVIAGSRRDLTYIVARRDSDGYPLIPTRLLFAAEEKTIADRALAFFGPRTETQRPRIDSLVSARQASNFPIPQPDLSKVRNKPLSPTAFRSYMACPYRFFLQRMLKLEPLRDDMEELDGGMFGTLAHAVLENFGQSEQRYSCDAEEIAQVLRENLLLCTRELVGEHPLTPIAVQIEQLRTRLDIVAEKQAEWASQGWRILYTEVPGLKHPIEFDVDGQPQRIHGYIDRIDQHEGTGELAIIDYKTSDAGKSPEQAHRKSGEWIDLQLPLYRHLAASLELEGPFKMAYFLLPKDTRKIGFSFADWSEEELESADETARTVIRNIRAGRFWPPTDPAPPFSEDFAGICQDEVFEKFKIAAPVGADQLGGSHHVL